jgi:hypothetical protein
MMQKARDQDGEELTLMSSKDPAAVLRAALRAPSGWPYSLPPQLSSLYAVGEILSDPETVRLLVRVLRDCRVERFRCNHSISWTAAVRAELQPTTALALQYLVLFDVDRTVTAQAQAQAQDPSVVDLLRHCPSLNALHIDTDCPDVAMAVCNALADRRSWGPLQHCGLETLTVVGGFEPTGGDA